MTSAFEFLNLALQVSFIDVLLSGDNAVVIALACRALPDGQKRLAMLAGTGAAILLRVVLTLMASAVLQIPLLKLLGGIALVVIAIRLTLGDADDAYNDRKSQQEGSSKVDFYSVMATVVIADLVMSADNVVALAAVAKGSFATLTLGLLLSVPLLMFGSWHITTLLERHPILIRLGGALLGWIAGDIAVTDPLYVGWISRQSPALSLVVPILTALYVLFQSRIVEESLLRARALRPADKHGLLGATPSPRRPASSEFVTSLDVSTLMAKGVESQIPREPLLATLLESGADQRLPLAFEADPKDSSPVTGGRPKPVARAWPWRWVATVGGVLGACIAIYGVLNFRWMPVPADFVHYECPGNDVSLDYRAGGQRIHMSNGANSANGIVRYDNQIDWGDYYAVSTSLGVVPPTHVRFANAQSVRIDGGMFENVNCNARR
jgi:YjbE family integral membrane protein